MSESETHAQQPTKQQQIVPGRAQQGLDEPKGQQKQALASSLMTDERPLRQHTPGHPHPVNPYEPNDADTILSAAQDIQRKLMVTALQLAAVVVTAMFMW